MFGNVVFGKPRFLLFWTLQIDTTLYLYNSVIDKSNVSIAAVFSMFFVSKYVQLILAGFLLRQVAPVVMVIQKGWNVIEGTKI